MKRITPIVVGTAAQTVVFLQPQSKWAVDKSLSPAVFESFLVRVA